MVSVKVELKNQVDINKKSRVYFTCHPEDFEKYFKKVCDDIFKTHDCAIYYTEDMNEIIAEDEKTIVLGRNNLFVVPITHKLLTTPNRAMNEDIPYALQEHIPILPIMMEPGIDVLYSKPDKFGELQYLNLCSTDLTEISYEDKLKKCLESVLISKELSDRIRKAFDAYIFLSYRKKDRKYANELMRLIHSIPECRDIAIWFDEFLTPGESFKENIEKILDDSKLFTLLVTPHILEKDIDQKGIEKDNFVIEVELPLAQQKKEEKAKQGELGGDIVPVKAEDINETDEKTLKDKGVTGIIDARSVDLFKNLFLEAILRNGIRKSDDNPKHNFLIGLAYLDGIDVEVNRELALELISSAAEVEPGLPEAMEKLYTMYSDGVGVTINYKKAVTWAEKYANYMVKEFGEENKDTLVALNNLAYSYDMSGDHEKALKLNEKVYTLRCQVVGEKNADTLISLNNLAYSYGEIGNYKKKCELDRKAYKLSCKVLGYKHPYTLHSLNNLASVYGYLGKYEQEVKLKKKVYRLRCKVLGERHPDTIVSLGNLATAYGRTDAEKTIKLAEEVYAFHYKECGEEHPLTIVSLNNLASVYNLEEDQLKIIELRKKVYKLSCKVLGEKHPKTLSFMNNTAVTYYETGNIEEALKFFERTYMLQCEVLGSEHVDALGSLHGLARCCYDKEQYDKSFELFQKAYESRCTVLGEKHPDTLTSLSFIASIYSKNGDYQKAIELNERLYTLRCELLGEEHSDAVNTLMELGGNYLSLCDKENLCMIQRKIQFTKFKLCMKEYCSYLKKKWMIKIKKCFVNKNDE